MNYTKQKIKAILICCTIIGSLFGSFINIGSTNLSRPDPMPDTIVLVELPPDNKQDIIVEIIKTAKKNNPGLTAPELLGIATGVYESSLEFNLDYQLILAVIEQESHFRIKAVSHQGALGLMQLMPATGRALATELNLENYPLTDISTNITLGSYYLYLLSQQFEDRHAVLTAYNRGPTGLQDFVRQTGSSKSNYSSAVLAKYPLY